MPARRVPTIESVLAEHLIATGMTQAAIGYRLGLSQQAVSDRMTGRTAWSAREVPVVCQLVGIAPGALYAQVVTP